MGKNLNWPKLKTNSEIRYASKIENGIEDKAEIKQKKKKKKKSSKFSHMLLMLE